MSGDDLFFHVDLDAFFASVEQLDNPDYRGKPVIVGGDPDKRGVISTCSYEARKFGVHSAMPTAQALRLCPQAVFLHGRMHRYFEKSREVMKILSDFSPDVQQISIDEAFLDMTGTLRLFGPAEMTAKDLKARVRKETGLTISVGAAPNRYLAKIASGLSKPDGLVIVQPGGEADFMAARPLKDVWGVGEKTRARLESVGLSTIAAIRECPQRTLAAVLGDAGAAFLGSAVFGIDPGILSGESASHSLSSEHTFSRDILDMDVLETLLLELSEDIMFRLLDEGLCGRTVQVKILYGDFRTVTARETGDRDIRDSLELFTRANALFRRKYEPGAAIRLLGLGVCNVYDSSTPEQMDLFDDGSAKKKRLVEKAVHDLALKRGKRLVTKARLIDGGNGGDS